MTGQIANLSKYFVNSHGLYIDNDSPELYKAFKSDFDIFVYSHAVCVILVMIIQNCTKCSKSDLKIFSFSVKCLCHSCLMSDGVPRNY